MEIKVFYIGSIVDGYIEGWMENFLFGILKIFCFYRIFEIIGDIIFNIIFIM